MVRSRHFWSPEEDSLLWKLHGQAKTAKQIAAALKKQFGWTTPVTPIAINSRLHGIRVGDIQISGIEPESREQETYHSGISLGARLAEYDAENVQKILRQRDEFIYNLMAEQARAIRNYGIFSRYERLTMREIMALEKREKEKVVGMLEKPEEKPDISNIGLLLLNPRAIDYFSVILPIRVVDVQGGSKASLESSLNDAFLGTMVKDLGYKPFGELFRGTFKDLVRYSFGMPVKSRDDISEKVQGVVSSEFPDVKRVYLFDSSLPTLQEIK
jgi:hypothetical protein